MDYGLALDPDVVSGFFGFGFTRGTYFTWIAQRDGELTSLGLPIMLPQFEGLIWILDLRLDLPIFWNLRLDLPIFWNLRLDLRCLCYSQDLRVSRECPLA